MGCYMSKECLTTTTSAATKLPYKLCSYEVASSSSATSCFAMTQQVVDVIWRCKKDKCGNRKLFEEHFETSLKTLDFCLVLDKCLKRARDSQLLVLAALNQFDEERERGSDTYSITITQLKSFRAAGDPFTEEFFLMSQSVYRKQMEMFRKVQKQTYELDRKLKCINVFRNTSNVMFMSAFAAVLVSSVVAVSLAAPPVAAALSAACCIPVRFVGKWVDSLWDIYEKALKRQKVVINSIQAGTYVIINDLDTIRVLVEKLEIDIASMLNNAELALEQGEISCRIADMRKRLGRFMTDVESLGLQAGVCSRDIRRARTVTLQRILKIPNNI